MTSMTILHVITRFSSGGAARALYNVLPNGFDTERLLPDPVRGQSIRIAIWIPEGAEVIGHVARFYPKIF